MPKKKPSGASTWVDPDAAPELTKEFFQDGTVYDGERIVRRGRGRPPAQHPKRSVSLRLDADVLETFRGTGPGWQGRMNTVLRKAASRLAGRR